MKNCLFIVLLLFSLNSIAQLSEKNIKNTSAYEDKGRYKWRIYIDAAPGVLVSIDKVEYTLHPTFAQPVVFGDPRNNFSYTAIGWGEFNVKVKVMFKDNTSQVLNHWLDL